MGGGVSVIEQELCRPQDAADVAASKEEAVREVQRLRGLLADCKVKIKCHACSPPRSCSTTLAKSFF